MSLRVPGHTLILEGYPHNGHDCNDCILVGTPGTRSPHYRTSGPGHGLCSCGAESEHLHSTNARKDWHYFHKKTITEGEA